MLIFQPNHPLGAGAQPPAPPTKSRPGGLEKPFRPAGCLLRTQKVAFQNPADKAMKQSCTDDSAVPTLGEL